MYPGMIGWWKHAHRHGHGGREHGPGGEGGFEARVECGPCEPGDRDGHRMVDHLREHFGDGRGGGGWGGRGGRGGHGGHGGPPESFAGPGPGPDHDGHFGGFGVRRPLRFLAYKLELNEQQVEELASILNDLKTERAQGDVDLRRSTAVIAEAIAGETLDAAKLATATNDRVKSAERLRDAVVKAIGRIHTMLSAEQRSRFAYLIRTGVLSI